MYVVGRARFTKLVIDVFLGNDNSEILKLFEIW